MYSTLTKFYVKSETIPYLACQPRYFKFFVELFHFSHEHILPVFSIFKTCEKRFREYFALIMLFKRSWRAKRTERAMMHASCCSKSWRHPFKKYLHFVHCCLLLGYSLRRVLATNRAKANPSSAINLGIMDYAALGRGGAFTCMLITC